MADANSGTPERVAYRLFEHIQAVEDKSFSKDDENPADREWILTTYAECLKVVRGGEADKETGANRVSIAKETGSNKVSLAAESGTNRVL